MSDAIADCVSANRLIFPVVADLKRFRDLAPEALHEYNGFELPADEEVVDLATLVLESLGLLRQKRKVFISYARHETRAVDATTGKCSQRRLDHVIGVVVLFDHALQG